MFLLLLDRELALGFLIFVGELFERLHRFIISRDFLQKLDVGLGVFVPGEHLRVVGQRRENLIQCLFHLFSGAFEEFSAPSVEQCVACENDALVAGLVLEEPADAVLRVARCVQRRYLDVLANVKCAAVGGCFCDAIAVLACDDGDGFWKGREDFNIPTCVVPMVMRVHDRGQI